MGVGYPRMSLQSYWLAAYTLGCVHEPCYQFRLPLPPLAAPKFTATAAAVACGPRIRYQLFCTHSP